MKTFSRPYPSMHFHLQSQSQRHASTDRPLPCRIRTGTPEKFYSMYQIPPSLGLRVPTLTKLQVCPSVTGYRFYRLQTFARFMVMLIMWWSRQATYSTTWSTQHMSLNLLSFCLNVSSVIWTALSLIAEFSVVGVLRLNHCGAHFHLHHSVWLLHAACIIFWWHRNRTEFWKLYTNGG